jgi:sec-independent protein translocase protein TatA
LYYHVNSLEAVMFDFAIAAVFGLGVTELLLIFAIVVVIFGASRLPQLGRGVGEGISNLRDGLKSKDKPAIEEKKNPQA